MFGIGFPELILILIIGLVVFGPGKLPEIGRAVGKALQEFKKASSEFSNSLNDTSSKSSITPTPPNPANPGQPSVPPVFMRENMQNNSRPAESGTSAVNSANTAGNETAAVVKPAAADIKNKDK